jgi:hypothetical protein
VGSWAQLRVGDLEIAHFKSEIESSIALVFTAGDWSARPASPDELERYGQDEPWEISELAAPISVIRDRLDVTGSDWGAVNEAFDAIVAERKQQCHQFIADEIAPDHARREIAYLNEFTLNAWVAAVSSASPDAETTSRMDVGTLAWLIGLWEYGDIRLCLRAVIQCRRDDDLVIIDATDLIDGRARGRTLRPPRAATGNA